MDKVSSHFKLCSLVKVTALNPSTSVLDLNFFLSLTLTMKYLYVLQMLKTIRKVRSDFIIFHPFNFGWLVIHYMSRNTKKKLWIPVLTINVYQFIDVLEQMEYNECHPSSLLSLVSM